MLLSLLLTITVSIGGPSVGKVDEVVTLDAIVKTGEKEEAKNMKWLIPQGIRSIPTKSGKLHLVPAESGTYSIALVAVNAEYEIAAATHEVVVSK